MGKLKHRELSESWQCHFLKYTWYIPKINTEGFYFNSLGLKLNPNELKKNLAKLITGMH